jgi:hypothetical protein
MKAESAVSFQGCFVHNRAVNPPRCYLASRGRLRLVRRANAARRGSNRRATWRAATPRCGCSTRALRLGGEWTIGGSASESTVRRARRSTSDWVRATTVRARSSSAARICSSCSEDRAEIRRRFARGGGAGRWSGVVRPRSLRPLRSELRRSFQRTTSPCARRCTYASASRRPRAIWFASALVGEPCLLEGRPCWLGCATRGAARSSCAMSVRGR